MPSTDLLVATLNLTELEKRRPEVKQCFDSIRAKFEPIEDEAAQKKRYPDLCKAFKASLNHDAREQTEKLLQAFPQHPLLRIMLAQILMNLKETSAAASLLYRLEAEGLPEEVMLEMKARFCAATADEGRSHKLKSELRNMLDTKEKVELETHMTVTAASSLTWAWLGALAGFSMAIIGGCGCFTTQVDTEQFLFGTLAVLGVGVLGPSLWWIRKNNKVLHELKVYRREKA
jgi:hypothetical protein